VLVLVAALNEAEGIGYTLEELRKTLVNPFFLVVDGNSTDRTVEIAKDFGAVVIPQKGAGKGDAYAEALLHLESVFDYVVLIDADYTYPAGFLPKMIQILNENPEVGMVCGNRFNNHFHLGSMPNAFYFGNRFLAFTHNLLNGVSLRDPLTGLRVVRGDVLRDWLPKSKGFDIEVELNHHVERRGYDIKEIDIPYRSRLGEKKLKLKHGFTIIKRILTESIC
jgi:glycosyltransferase involved in cell wall biosynthesis